MEVPKTPRELVKDLLRPLVERGEAMEYLARSLANEPDSVVIDAEERRGGVRLNVHVAPEDMGRVIGRRGRTAQAIRTLAIRGAPLIGVAAAYGLALELQRPRRQFGVARFGEERIEAAAMIDAAQRLGADAQPDRTAERIGNQRDVKQVGQKPPLGFAVGVADPVADLPRLTGQLASPCHGRESCPHAGR